jgi:nitrite reductase (NADH) small subunit
MIDSHYLDFNLDLNLTLNLELMSGRYVKIGRITEFPPNKGKRVTIGDHAVAIWHVGDRFFAMSDICAHQHLPVMHEAILDGTTITCPMHGWSYSLETGTAVNGSGRLKVYGVKLFGKELLIELPSDE